MGSLSSPFRRGDSSRSMATIPSPGASTQNIPSSPPRETIPLPPAAEVPLSLGDERRSNDQTNGDVTAHTSAGTSNERPMNGVRELSEVAQQQGSQTGRSAQSPAVVCRLILRRRLRLTYFVQRDADGFTVPPSRIDDISRAEQEASAKYDTSQLI